MMRSGNACGIRKFLVLVGLCIGGYGITGQELRFDKFIIEDGLTSINAILIDDFGYKWFGGTHGLYRYDGYGFDIFTHDPADPNTLSHNDVMVLFEDSNQNIWIGTSNNGVNVYESRTESILRLTDIQELSMSTVTAFEEDEAGNLWIGTLGNGVVVLSPERTLIKHFSYNILDPSSLSNNDVFDFLIDSGGRFWVVTNSGSLDLFRPEDGRFEHYLFSEKPLVGVRSGQKLLEIDSSTLWIGTEGQGIFQYDVSSGRFTQFHAAQSNSLSNNIITGLAKDSGNNIWISTDGGGLNYFNTTSRTFSHFLHSEGDEFSLSNNASYSLLVDQADRVWLGMGDGKVNISSNSPFRFIRSSSELSFNVVVDLHIDQYNKLWVATGGGGVDLFDLERKKRITNLSTRSLPPLKTNVILSVHESQNSDIWIGTLQGGVNEISYSGKLLNNFMHEETSNSLANDHVFDIAGDQQGNLWFATQGGGIDRFDPASRSFDNFNSKDNSGLVSDRIQALFIDHRDRVWVGHFRGGLQLFDVKSGKFILVELPGNLNQKLKRYPIHFIYEDASHNLLLCTGGLGLVVLSAEFDTFKIYNIESGLPSNAVYGVIQFKNSYWLSTNNGISEINLKTNETQVINKNDGLLTNDFESGSIAASQAGALYFGSKEGVVYFPPDQIDQDNEQPVVVFTDLSVFDQAVRPGEELGGEVILEKSLHYCNRINLPYSHNNVSLSFASPSFEKPGKLLFRHKLSGLQERWVLVGSDRRFVNYSNIGIGEYGLRVQASADGGKTWSGERSVQLVVHPPFYLTPYAYVVYFMLLLLLGYIIYQFIRGKVALRNQLKFEKFAREKDNDLNREKINFFTGVSHEIRTPLTLILGHLERLTQFNNADGRLKYELGVIRKNGNRLLTLINQLLDFRKMESGQMQLKVSRQQVSYTIREILLPFRELAIQKNIVLTIQEHLFKSSAYFDISKLELILYNLLSNALKFTPSDGHIEVFVACDEDQLEIRISDSGQGIAKENLKKIFDPFFQGSAGNQYGITGTGIGLSLVSEMVNLHRGSVIVESKQHEGSVFTVKLPSARKHYNDAEIVESETPAVEGSLPVDQQDSTLYDVPGMKLLLVEDNPDILKFLNDSFSDQFEVTTATNGKEGLDRSLEVIPDMIISDVMMPEMDGMEMCRHLKRDIRTNHIPIILLTARTGFMHEHSGLETGADDYITKPFQVDLLNIRMHNLIENRKLVHQKFRKELLLEPRPVDVNDPNEQFISDLMGLVEEHMSNTEFTVKDLARSMGLSHSVLYRKIHALTNLSINDFIKSVRLKRSLQLLGSGAYNISDISYMVGFSNPKYFSTCFKAEFGVSPSEYDQNKGGAERQTALRKS